MENYLMHEIFIIYINHYECVVIDNDLDVHSIKQRKNAFLKHLCQMYHKDLTKQLRNNRRKLNIKQKPPILLDKKTNFIIFPIYSYRSNNNIFFNYAQIKKVKNIHDQYTKITFVNNSDYIIKCNIRIIKRQIKRCEKLIQEKKKSV